MPETPSLKSARCLILYGCPANLVRISPVRCLAKVRWSGLTAPPKFASLTVRFLRSVCERFVRDDEFLYGSDRRDGTAYGWPPEPSRARHRRTLRVSA